MGALGRTTTPSGTIRCASPTQIQRHVNVWSVSSPPPSQPRLVVLMFLFYILFPTQCTTKKHLVGSNFFFFQLLTPKIDWDMTIWMKTFFKVWSKYDQATWQFWAQNDVKSVYLVGLRQNNAQKWRKHAKICVGRSISVVWTHYDTSYSTLASSRGAFARMHMRQKFVILTCFEL